MNLLSIIIITCFGTFVYSNTFFCPFHFDDYHYIVNNLYIRNFHDLLNIWEFYPCRFVTFLSFAVNYHFHQLHVLGYHLFNLAVHLVSALLVWRLVLLTLSTPAMRGDQITRHANFIALLAGLIFVAHPIQTEAVTYIWQRTASMAAMFYLASMCLYVKSRSLQDEESFKKIASSPAAPRKDTIRFYYIGALITAILAMFTKEMAISLPFMILLYEFSFFKIRKNLDWKYVTPFLLTLLIIPLTIMLLPKSVRVQEMQGVEAGFNVISPMHYFLTQLRVMVTYIRLAFLPLNQNIAYDYPVFRSIFELPVLSSLLFLMAVLFFAKALFSKYRLVSFSILWFFVALLPESSVVPLEDVIFEHRLYLALAGYSIFLVSGVYYLWGKNNLKTMVIVLTGVVTWYSVLTFQRNMVWKDEITLWSDTIQKSPHKIRPYTNRGVIYDKQGNLTLALSDFSKVIEISPSDAVAYANRGVVYFKQGNFTQALLDFNFAIRLNPNYAEAYNYRGSIYAIKSNLPRSMSDFAKAIAINPDYAEAYYNRGVFYYQLKEYAKAWREVHKAEELGDVVDPGFINKLKGALALMPQ